MNQGGVLACCAVCNQQTHRRCGRCLNIFYCTTEHQREDWKRHKSECAPKLPKQDSRQGKSGESSLGGEDPKIVRDQLISADSSGKDIKSQKGSVSESRRSKKSKKKSGKNEGSGSPLLLSSNVISKQINQVPVENDNRNKVRSSASNSTGGKDSVISSVVYTNKDLRKTSAITYEGSSEQEILSESVQQLSTIDFQANSTANVLHNSTDDKMLTLPAYGTETVRKEYPEASLRGSGAPFASVQNSYYMDPSDPCYEICHRVIRDMTQYGVCVLDNFLGKDRGLLVLNEVLEMYRSGIFTAGQLVSNPKRTEAQTVRSDRITWIDGKEPQCFCIGQLISQVDSIVLRANKMANNGRMGDYFINGRTKAMVACYPGSGSHYVKHVDNPNKDGRCITAIYYLNLDWDVKQCGGLLRVFPEGTNQVADIAPIFDRMLFFWSDRRNPHEVQPAHSTRYAITLWYFDAQEREEARRHYKERGQPSSSK